MLLKRNRGGGGVPKLDPHNKDYSIWGSILGYTILGNYYIEKRTNTTVE